MTTYIYRINLNERGAFYADVYREDTGETVMTIKDGNELDEDESSIFEDGFMAHHDDLAGLLDHMLKLGIMADGDNLISDNW